MAGKPRADVRRAVPGRYAAVVGGRGPRSYENAPRGRNCPCQATGWWQLELATSGCGSISHRMSRLKAETRDRRRRSGRTIVRKTSPRGRKYLFVSARLSTVKRRRSRTLPNSPKSTGVGQLLKAGAVNGARPLLVKARCARKAALLRYPGSTVGPAGTSMPQGSPPCGLPAPTLPEEQGAEFRQSRYGPFWQPNGRQHGWAAGPRRAPDDHAHV